MVTDAIDLFLASGSPRRSQMLAQMGVKFSVLANDVDESLQATEAPRAYVSRLAMAKAERGFSNTLSSIPVLGADTVVVLGQQIFGKPCNSNEAHSMLTALSGRVHSVITAVAVTNGLTTATRVSTSDVRFRKLTGDERRDYVATGEPMGKAGGYAIQGFGGIFVEHLAGSYSGVVGLPVDLTHQLLQLFGVSVWGSLSDRGVPT
ncbi:MAG: Maf family protein [Porticoccaceae bacterium]|nr:Maf family protein [Porticoccaceae bacterium]